MKRRSGLRRVSGRRRAEMELDRAARHACLMAANGRCERCGTGDGSLEWHHVVTRRLRSTRWRNENALALCHGCHRWWHANPADARQWFIEKFGQARMDLLHSLRAGKGGGA